jgi:hypothetical protein
MADDFRCLGGNDVVFTDVRFGLGHGRRDQRRLPGSHRSFPRVPELPAGLSRV